MSKRFDNKLLIVLLSVLAILMALTVIVRIPNKSATLKSRVLSLDTLAVSKIIIYPKFGDSEPVEFNKSGNTWTVQQGQIVSATRKDAVKNIFSELTDLKPQSLAAINKSKWEDFEVTDSLATRIKFLNAKGKVLGDLMIGKLNYKQQQNPYGQYGGSNVQGTTFVRNYDEKEVYSVEGFLAFFFGGGFDSWRDKTFIHSNRNDILSLGFTYPSDSGFILNKNESSWFVSSQVADSVKVAEYLNSLSNLNGQVIDDNFKPSSNPEFQLFVEGNNLVNFNVKAYRTEESDEFILNSSLNPNVYFSSKKDGVFGKIFKPVTYFIKH